MSNSALLEQRDEALQEQAARKEKNKDTKRVDNTALYAGSPMYYYCRGCNEEMVLSETHSEPSPKLCYPCKELAEIQEKLTPKDIPTRIEKLKQRAPMWAHGGTMHGVRRLRKARNDHERGINAVLNICDKELPLQELTKQVRYLNECHADEYFVKAARKALKIIESYDEKTMLLNETDG